LLRDPGERAWARMYLTGAIALQQKAEAAAKSKSKRKK